MLQTKQTKIKGLNCYPSTGALDNSFIGIKIRGNNIDFYYPEAYYLSDDDYKLKQDIISVLKTISIAKTKEKNSMEVFTSRVNDTDFALDSYLWVIRDFLANGYYINREKVYKINQKGKVNWKRTLDNTPFVSKNKNIIYKDIVVETKDSIDNLLVEIHKLCIKKSIDYIGWLFNLNSNFIQTKPFDESVKKQYIGVLSKELSHTFDDNKKTRLCHLKNVIQGLDANLEGKDFVYGVDSYEYIFERMIDNIFSNKNVEDFYPSGEWNLVKPKREVKKSSNLRPDTIFSHGKDLYILDSKYYRFGITGNSIDLPETSSIQKQISYGDYVYTNKKDKFDNIFNAFLIPYNKKNNIFNCFEDLTYVGFAMTDTNESKKIHEHVHTFLIDLKHVITTYNSLNHVGDVDSLVNQLNEITKEEREK